MDSRRNSNCMALRTLVLQKPTHFTSVAGGIQKRLETNIKEKRRTRFTNFDSCRNLPECESPVPKPLNKTEQRKLQLLKWKEEKEKKKAEAFARKKKPFVVGVARTMTFEPPPPISWPLPSTSGRVTRSQAARGNTANRRDNPRIYTFAPQNAVFNPTLTDLEIPTSSTFGEQSSEARSSHDAPRQEPRSLRSRTKLNVATQAKQNQNKMKTQKKSAPKKKLANQPSTSNTQSKLIFSSTASSSSDGDMCNEETVAFKFTSPPKHVKGRKSNTTKQKGKSKMIASKNSERLVNISSSTSMDTDIDDKHSQSPQVFIPNVTVTTNKDTDIDDEPTQSPQVSIPNVTVTPNKDTDIDDEPTQSPQVSIPNVTVTPNKDTDIDDKPSPSPQVFIPNITVTPNKDTDINDEPTQSPQVSIPYVTVTPNKENTTIQDFIIFTPKNSVPKSESRSEGKLRSPKALVDVPVTPEATEVEYISPRVCLSRGKDNARKEMKKKIDEGLLDEDNISDMSVDHFQRQLDSEIKRMTEMCEVWDKILEQNVTLPDEIQEAVLSAVGQARLLMSQKLQQFASLLRRCDKPETGQALVTRADLQGFWDMVFLQIVNVDVRFNKLEQSRARGWASEQPPAGAARAAKPPPKPPQPKPPARARPAPSNRLKDIIAAARKAKQANIESTKTFDAGFFNVQSPVKSPATTTPLRTSPGVVTPLRKPTMLQSVLSSEARKASAKKSSFAMMRASSLSKSVDSEEGTPHKANRVAPTPINLGLTPGKSILKSNNNTTTKTPSKILSFKLLSSDTASGSSPTSDGGQISGVEKLRDLDTSPDTSPPKLHNLDDLPNSQRSATPPRLQIQDFANLQISENSATDTDKFEEKKTRRSSRRTKKSLHDTEDNLVGTNTEVKQGKENRRSSRKVRESSPTEKKLISTNTETRRTSRRTKKSLHNTEDYLVGINTAQLKQGKENRRSSRKETESSPTEQNFLSTNTEDKKNRRSLRKKTRSPNAEENLVAPCAENIHDNNSNLTLSKQKPKLARQDAMEEITPVTTRSRRKTRQTPENLENVGTSRSRKTLLEVNEEKMDVTPTSSRSRRHV
ncbi:disks large-associated protein 5 [Maniola hyperantus]|uniref:disks large-associated protein 5 n=1 Tax=Aphantopus hyperantus TaxID=2795564 RepID=UPI0021235C9E